MFKVFFYSFLVFFNLVSILKASDQQQVFESKVRPILHDNCIMCHGPEKQKGGLRLDHIDFIKDGGESGPVINFKDLKSSKILKVISYKDATLKMPPQKAGGQLNLRDLEILKQWILSGAYWPKENTPNIVGFVPGKIQEEDRRWWAFQSFDEVKVPTHQSSWANNSIDLFIEAELKQQQLKPAPTAGKRELIRRVYYDLIGLPPSPEDIQAFIEDNSEHAYEKMVDNLLNSPKYGERWAQHWLDIVRFSESDGYRADHFRPQAYQYRDYVVNSFNQDKPYDLFVKEQLAGDEIDPGNREALKATMFLRHWIYEWNQRDVKMQWDIILNDITETTADVFMGMSISCAKCHNHKFDPILQKDFFRLQAYFQAILPRENMPIADIETRRQYEKKLEEWKQVTKDIRYQIHDIEYPTLLKTAKGEGFSKFVEEIQSMMLKHPDKRDAYETQIAEMAMRQLKIDRKESARHLIEQKPSLDELHKKLKAFEHLKPKPLPTMKFLVSDTGLKAPPTIIPDTKNGENIEPGVMSIFDPSPAKIPEIDPALKSTGRRSALANWIAHKNNPLTARVMVNRLWQHHFEKGLVNTPNNFGRLGELPTHPKLLDWLAKQFVEGGWKIKRIHKLICTSATYRQTSRITPSQQALQVDPQNRLLWKYPPRRLDAEQIRDSILSISGQLNDSQLGGVSIKGKEGRRSVYVQKFRNTPDLMLQRFNLPGGFKSTPARNITNTPLQSLLLFNSKWPLSQAEKMAAKIDKSFKSNESKVRRVFQLAYGREATAQELQTAMQFLEEQINLDPEHGENSGLTDLCHVVINSNEFLYLH